MSFINDNVLIKYHSDLVINWDSSSKEEYIAKKELLHQYQEMILDFNHDKQKYNYYNNGTFSRFLYQYYFILYQFSNNRCWFDFRDTTHADNYLKHGQKIKKISEIPWSKIFSFNKSSSHKFDSLVSIIDGDLYYRLTTKKSCSEREKITFKYYLFKLLLVTQILNPGGKYMTRVYSYFYNKTIDLIYLFLFFFDKVHINEFNHIIALGYNPKMNLIGDLPTFFNNLFHKKFIISPKKELPKIIKYLHISLKERIRRYTYIHNSNFRKFLQITNNDYINLLIERNFWISKSNTLNLLPVSKQINMDQDKYDILYYLETDFQKSLRKKNSQIMSINNCTIMEIERQVLKKVFLKNRHLKKCLVINIGTGITCLELMIQMFKIKTKESTLYLIDQFQKDSWDNYGLRLLEQSGISIPIKLLVGPSYQSLSKLEKKMLKTFDLIYLGGRYNYENINTDFFYVYNLLSPEGFLIVDCLLNPMIEELIISIEKEESYQLDIVEKNNLVAVYRKKH